MHRRVVVVCAVVVFAVRDAHACPPRCATPEGALRDEQEELYDAFGCEMVEEDLSTSVLRWHRTGLVRTFEWFLRARRNAASFHARADLARSQGTNAVARAAK